MSVNVDMIKLQLDMWRSDGIVKIRINKLDENHILFIVEFIDIPTRENYEKFEDWIRAYLNKHVGLFKGHVWTWSGFFNCTKFDTIIAHKEVN